MPPKQFRPFRITLDIWLARFGSLFGWVWLVFWALIGVVGLGECLSGQAKETTDIFLSFFCLGLAALHYLLIRACRNTKHLVGQFRLFCAFFAHNAEKSIPDAARALNLPLDTAMKELEALCRRGYFNGYIDRRLQRMVFPAESSSLAVVHCPGCGASTAIARTGDACRYCGSPLSR